MQDQFDEFEIHTNPLFIARVKRETGMALLRQATHVTDPVHRQIILNQVAALFDESYAQLCKDTSGSEIEAAITLSYMGQQLLIGGDRDGAYRFMDEADRLLRVGYAPQQELDNLVALLRAVECSKRRVLYRRIRPLLTQTGQLQRRAEIIVYVLGGDRLLDFATRHTLLFILIRRLYRK